ncbi:hypothetical protein ACFLZC_00885 [Patescibacteria group bacterium]
MDNVLSKLFGSKERLKILRLFLLNGECVFSIKDISERAKMQITVVRKEINLLKNINFLRKKKITKNEKKVEGWVLNKSFTMLKPLKELILDTTPFSKTDFLKKANSAGRMKLIVLSGIFIKNDASRIDILIVGDKIRKNLLEKVLKEVEAEVGKELAYAIFETSDFVYRLNICDKFIRDILDYPHQKILNKLSF